MASSDSKKTVAKASTPSHYRYFYKVYNVGQYPEESLAEINARSRAGWRVHTVSLNYSEVGIFWELVEGQEPDTQGDPEAEFLAAVSQDTPAENAGVGFGVEPTAETGAIGLGQEQSEQEEESAQQ